MRTILHPDYWCEILGGEVQLGLTPEQKIILWRKRCEVNGYSEKSSHIRQQTDEALQILKRGETLPVENTGMVRQSWQFPMDEEARIIYIPTFYIYRYPITDAQMLERHKRPIDEIPGTLELIIKRRSWIGKVTRTGYSPYIVAETSEAIAFCTKLGGRLPTADEWEKAARGTDGRIYPWGNEWDEARGYFYREQKHLPEVKETEMSAVDVFLDGASPYGVMAMAGGLPELVTVQLPYGGIDTELKGCHTRNSSAMYAFWDHRVSAKGIGWWRSFRPVLDTWPRQQWRGVEVQLPDSAK
jgi:formylglycine-generating enzyme required for sulfatase activity